MEQEVWQKGQTTGKQIKKRKRAKEEIVFGAGEEFSRKPYTWSSLSVDRKHPSQHQVHVASRHATLPFDSLWLLNQLDHPELLKHTQT